MTKKDIRIVKYCIIGVSATKYMCNDSKYKRIKQITDFLWSVASWYKINNNIHNIISLLIDMNDGWVDASSNYDDQWWI